MKIGTNFVPPARRAVMPVVGAIWCVALALAVAAGWLIRDAVDLREELPELRARLARLTAETAAPRIKQISPVRLPPATELADARSRVAKINAAAQTKGMPTLALLAELERRLPPESWLINLHHRALAGEVMLVAAAWSADPLSAFLLRLERDPLFEDAMLVREAHGQGGQTQFEIRVKVRQ